MLEQEIYSKFSKKWAASGSGSKSKVFRAGKIFSESFSFLSILQQKIDDYNFGFFLLLSDLYLLCLLSVPKFLGGSIRSNPPGI